ncbi:MAG: radical SAM protein [Planctomycetes bacterium]|nr:radical SAM protein [Planctomycetota bacterium]
MSTYVFGPVPSRRLGRSLGIDLVPFKTCTYDCLYCQLGRTTCKTVERKEWVPLDPVVNELEKRLDSRPDYITLSGSGEPTLFSRLDELVARIKAITSIPVAVLTNGSLLGNRDVQRQLSRVDLVIPSLDAGGEALFRLVNCPHESLTFEGVLAGLVSFRRRFAGQYCLEVFMLAAYTTSEAERAAIQRCIDLIKPDRVQLNTVTRPPADGCATAVSRERLEAIAAEFSPPAEVIADLRGDLPAVVEGTDVEPILALLRRRPCTVEDIARGLSIAPPTVAKQMEALQAQHLVEPCWNAGNLYYRSASSPAP